MNPAQAGLRMTLARSPRPQDLETLRQRLEEHGSAVGVNRGRAVVAIFLRDPDGDVVGGVYGTVGWQVLRLNALWVREGLRGFGYGARLLQQIERVALEKGCRQVLVQGLSFQDLGFLEKRGYQTALRLHDIPPGHDHVLLRKPLGVGASKVTSATAITVARGPAPPPRPAPGAHLERRLARRMAPTAGGRVAQEPTKAPAKTAAPSPAPAASSSKAPDPKAPEAAQLKTAPAQEAKGSKEAKDCPETPQVSCAPEPKVPPVPARQALEAILKDLPEDAGWAEIDRRIHSARPSQVKAAERDMAGIRTCLVESEPYLLELNESVKEINEGFKEMAGLLDLTVKIEPSAQGASTC